MKLYDGKKTVNITIREWDNRYNSANPDWSLDFFEAGGLEFDEDREAYIVSDVDYCIDYAKDWQCLQGDFKYDECPDYIERQVFVDVE